jgi:hypothetical protein
MRPRRPQRLVGALCALAIAALIVPTLASAAGSTDLTAAQRATLLGYARNTWASFVAMTDPASGLPADSLDADGTASVQTSTTNIGAYMWSAVVAERLGIIGHAELVARLGKTLHSLETMERDQTLGADGRPSGQYFNWYDHLTGAVLTIWPPTGEVVNPILSSVDNGWLAAAIHVVATTVPELSPRATTLFDSMDFGFYYRPAANRIAFYYRPSDGDSPCCYDTIVSESRIASYIGIATGTIPAKEYFGAWRTFPATCDWNWQESQPVGVDRTYLGVKVFEGAYNYDGFRVVPGWGGSMFEALMPTLFVPEEQWGPRSWAINHPLTVAAQIHHGMVEAGYGYWGFSPSNTPEGGYAAYGVDGIGMNPDGYPSNEDNTFVTPAYCGRAAVADPPPSAYTNGVVTPHAAFLAVRYAPNAALADLAKLQANFTIYDKWGFHDSVNVGTGKVSAAYLSLDQGIIMAAIGNALAHDMLRDAFATKAFRKALQPVIGMETFNAGPRDAADAILNP